MKHLYWHQSLFYGGGGGGEGGLLGHHLKVYRLGFQGRTDGRLNIPLGDGELHKWERH